jgi:hypothetical protein
MMFGSKISQLDVNLIYILVYFNANRSIKTSQKINEEIHLGDHEFKNYENFHQNIQTLHPHDHVVSHDVGRHLPDDYLIQT